MFVWGECQLKIRSYKHNGHSMIELPCDDLSTTDQASVLTTGGSDTKASLGFYFVVYLQIRTGSFGRRRLRAQSSFFCFFGQVLQHYALFHRETPAPRQKDPIHQHVKPGKHISVFLSKLCVNLSIFLSFLHYPSTFSSS